MAIITKSKKNIYRQLEYNFLYENDINSIYLLLNLYDIDKNIKNIYPNYITLDKLNEKFDYLSKENSNVLELLKFINEHLREEINRLELYTCLEGYREGYYSSYYVNKLESLAVNDILNRKLYNNKYLYHYDEEENKIIEIKDKVLNEINKDMKNSEIFEEIQKYIEKVIFKKMYKTFDLIIYSELIKKTIKLCITNLYKESYWYGLNDRVLKRYR